MKKHIGGLALVASISALALAPAGASAQAPPPTGADCSAAGIPGSVTKLNLAPVANITLRLCVPTGAADCDEAGNAPLRLPPNPLLRLQISDCRP